MENIAVLGSTGSIGRQTLDVIKHSEGAYRAFALCADSNAELLAAQANEFRPDYVGLSNISRENELRGLLEYFPTIISGSTAAAECAALSKVQTVINAVSGMAAIHAFMEAIRGGKRIAAANKESIVCAHALVNRYKKCCADSLVVPLATGARVVPVDSEQSAIFRCMEGCEPHNVKRLILTASGGMFHKRTLEEMRCITAADACKHPNWSMGRKITIDSSTMFNKGLEVLEAAYLFGMDADSISVVVQPQSIIHSMIELTDNTYIAQLAVPDMRAAIACGISRQLVPVIEPVDFLKLAAIEFAPVNPHLQIALDLAYAALREDAVLPIVYNAANEQAVDMFVRGETAFLDIARRVEYAMSKSYAGDPASMDGIIAIDAAARRYAAEWKER